MTALFEVADPKTPALDKYPIGTSNQYDKQHAMTTSNRSDAQQRADAIRVFQVELERLESAGVLRLDEVQHTAVRAHHQTLLSTLAQDFDIDRDVQTKQLSLGMRIASFLGAVALAASVFFLFYQFWGWFSTLVQVAVLVAAPLAAFIATLWIARKDSSGYFAKLAAMVTFACFVLNLIMLGQIFNITPSDKALLPWAALALLLAYALDLRLLLVAGILCLIAFIAARVGVWGGMYWLHFGERPENFFPAAVVLFLLPQWIDHRRFAGFAQAYRVLAPLTLFLPMLVLAHWGRGSYLALEPLTVERLYQVLGFVGTALLTVYGVRKQWNEVVNTGVTLFVVFLYTKLFSWWWDEMPKYLFFLLVGLIALLLLFVFCRLRSVAVTRSNVEVKA
jgi:uncharacterized membrane protein